jgi:hypothetical protein
VEVEEEARDLVEEKEAFREFLRKRARVREVALVGLKGTTEAPVDNEGSIVWGVVKGGVNGDLVIIGSAELTPKTR